MFQRFQAFLKRLFDLAENNQFNSVSALTNGSRIEREDTIYIEYKDSNNLKLHWLENKVNKQKIISCSEINNDILKELPTPGQTSKDQSLLQSIANHTSSANNTEIVAPDNIQCSHTYRYYNVLIDQLLANPINWQEVENKNTESIKQKNPAPRLRGPSSVTIVTISEPSTNEHKHAENENNKPFSFQEYFSSFYNSIFHPAPPQSDRPVDYGKPADKPNNIMSVANPVLKSPYTLFGRENTTTKGFNLKFTLGIGPFRPS